MSTIVAVDDSVGEKISTENGGETLLVQAGFGPGCSSASTAWISTLNESGQRRMGAIVSSLCLAMVVEKDSPTAMGDVSDWCTLVIKYSSIKDECEGYVP